MTFTLDQYAALRPYLYHVLAKSNLPAVRKSRTLWSAARLAERSGCASILAARRRHSIPVSTAEGPIVIRDQAPLFIGNVDFQGGWGPEDLLHELNSRVFLWPGGAPGPLAYGRRHADKYAATDVLLRLPFRDVADQMPQFCQYNSGSPRSYFGRKSPRGPETFLPAEECGFRPSQVVEVTFSDSLRLPRSAERSDEATSEWQPLFSD